LESSILGESLALKSSDAGLLRRGVQVAAVVGGEEELAVIQSLSAHEDPAVAQHARASAFYSTPKERPS
jgi:hypothetical protein